ncbi:MAG: hypothetical protein GY906_24335 [bacterium]|nr:hypothetical protein [bacterium]
MPNGRERKRKSSRIDKKQIVNRVLEFYRKDIQDRQGDIEDRLQRIAKFRMWTEGKDWPWKDASDVALPDMMTHSLRVQDTLHNAVMSARPPVFPKALHKTDKNKEDTVATLTDFQFFIEQPGESIVADAADAFVNDGVVTAFIPWIKETRAVVDRRIFEPIPDELQPGDYFRALLERTFSDATIIPTDSEWGWRIIEDPQKPEEQLKAEFFTSGRKRDEARVELDIRKEVTVYDGPRVLIKEYEDVTYPIRAKNLQMPSPSNPGGAAHVILVDYPTVDEIRRLAKSKFYDQITKEELDKLDNVHRDTSENQEAKDQKDSEAGTIDTEVTKKAKGHGTLTRLLCFDLFDMDSDGTAEDMMWWVLKETDSLLKATPMAEMYPTTPPRRPFAEASFIPVRERRAGISLLEMMEGLHDVIKMLTDQTVDTGTITGVPFWFYRASGAMKPEILRLAPGEGYPLGDPTRDVHFPNIQNNQASFGLNMISMLGQWEEKLTMLGDFQFGRVPPGRSAALRTIGTTQLLAGQGEARPERILRRFFIGLTEIFAQMHELNQIFLPKGKQILITGLKEKGQNPYMDITSTDKIKGRFTFDFNANAFNSSKQALQEALQAIGQTFINPLYLQMGLVNEGGIYRWSRNFAEAWGQDADQYLEKPEPGVGRMRILAEEAISAILRTTIPDGIPLEGALQHLQKLIAYAQSDQFGLLSDPQRQIFGTYLMEIRQMAQAEQDQQRRLAAAQQFQQANGAQGQPGAPVTTPPADLSQPQVQGNELLDETLPESGGGAVQ